MFSIGDKVTAFGLEGFVEEIADCLEVIFKYKALDGQVLDNESI